MPQLTGTPAALWSKTGQTLMYVLLAAMIAQLMPGLDAYRWMPDDRMELLPGLFRRAVVEPKIEGTVDDDLLVAMGPSLDDDLSDPTARPIPGAQLSTTPEAIDRPPEVGEPTPTPETLALEDHQVFESDAKLPRPPRVRKMASGLPLLAIEDPQGAMGRFYAKLLKTQRKDFGAVTRVLHYGDSLITGDYVTRTVRRLMQKKFGDAGHGFVLAGKPSPWYGRTNLKLRTSDGWDINRITRPTIKDGLYGLGGVTFRTRKRGQWLKASPSGDELGAQVSRLQVFYLAQPKGGRFSMDVDGRDVTVDTRVDEVGSRMAEIVVQDAPHTLKIRTLGHGEVRLFGVVMERDGPGVVYDSLGLDGARAKLLRRMNPPHWHEQIRLRRPDLLVIHYGTNESQATHLSAKRYRADLSEIVGHLRQALPGVSCLMVGPMDRAEKRGGKLLTRPVVKRIVAVQRQVAYAQGCAFFNTYRAMGGEHSMARWYRARPQLAGGDLTHPTRRGADRIGAMLFASLMDGYGAWLKDPRPQGGARR